MEKKTVLIAVDVQKDFIDGSLGGLTEEAVAERRGVVAPLVRLADQADVVIASRDFHPADHMSFVDEPQYADMSWPPHCVQGTEGVEIDPAIVEVADYIVSKGTDTKAEQYSAFEGVADEGKSVRKILEDLGGPEGVTVIGSGIADDYCVLATNKDLRKAGYEVILVREASAGVAPETTEAAIEEMRSLGVQVKNLVSDYVV